MGDFVADSQIHECSVMVKWLNPEGIGTGGYIAGRKFATHCSKLCLLSSILYFLSSFSVSAQHYTTLKTASKKQVNAYNDATKYLMQDNQEEAAHTLGQQIFCCIVV